MRLPALEVPAPLPLPGAITNLQLRLLLQLARARTTPIARPTSLLQGDPHSNKHHGNPSLLRCSTLQATQSSARRRAFSPICSTSEWTCQQISAFTFYKLFKLSSHCILFILFQHASAHTKLLIIEGDYNRSRFYAYTLYSASGI